MTNSILKSYLKKILKSEAFVSVIIVFVLAIGIIGTSYALYMDVDTDTNYQLVEVGDLSIGFNNGSANFTLENMTPTSDDIATGKANTDIAKEISGKNLFSFYIYNTGTYTANYNIKLVTDTGNTVDTNYINYQICRDNAENCKDINTLSNTTESIIYSDELTPNSTALDTNNTSPSAYYFLRVWINDQYEETSGTISLKVIIEAKNASGYLDTDNTLAGRLLSDERVTINNSVPDFSIAETAEKGMYKAEDDYGISYYYRGAQNYNYVNFAGFTWRVVRINGDGSIRLILDSLAGNGTSFSNGNCKGKYCVGYMLSNDENDFSNINNSKIKTEIDTWYENNGIDNYKDYLADVIFCGEKKFDGETHILNNNIRVVNAMPSLKCDIEASDNYSRYTVNNYTTKKNVETNGDLKYPIATISVDELLMAGGNSSVNNTNFYLYINTYSWWTMSGKAYDYLTNNIPMMFILSRGTLSSEAATNGEGAYYIRPVINLKADVLVDTGDGTKDIVTDDNGNVVSGPYTVKLS